MTKPRPILNDFTRAQLDEARARILEAKQPRAINCAWCDKPIKARAGQRFCCAVCRVAYSDNAARIEYEALLAERNRWALERLELIREITRLRDILRAHNLIIP